MKNKVSLQINLTPADYPHARHLLPHQLRVLGKQVDEIILTVDTQPGKGRFAAGWHDNKALLNKFLATEVARHDRVSVVPVDYTAAVKQKVTDHFFGKKNMPNKDFRGGPFYAYFFGLYIASNDLVFHLDSDLFLGGGSADWIVEATDLFDADNNCLIISPLPGPPHSQDILIDQQVIAKIAPYTWQIRGMSTRIFLIDKSKFSTHKLQITRPSLRNQIKAIVEGNAAADLPEHIISAFIDRHHFKRIDFLGKCTGLWSLHPPYRTPDFYAHLPALIDRVESNDLPPRQHGYYDMIDEVCDWSSARQALRSNRWWKKLMS